ncbi:MAG: diaminopimelate epimerase [Clostridia bacterium]|nr:diaminopimelate epimerase [Clostridia bacterium]
MQGLGNDYLYVYGEVPSDIVERCIKMSDRHFGAGSDGMIFISPSDVADFQMRIFNADGSEAKMCGNGIRCVGKYVFDKGYTDKTQLTVDTLSDVKHLTLHVKDGRVSTVAVEMGTVAVGMESSLTIDGQTVTYIPVSVGNPHAVVFVDDIEQAPLTTLGPKMEKHVAFPGGVNVEFVQVTGENTLRMRVWERGSGVTMACGTGACASTAAAAAKGLCEYGTPVTVTLDGGNLSIAVSNENNVTMTGPAEIVYEGEMAI